MTTQTDRVTAARLAWTALKLTRAGRHPVGVERLAATIGITVAETRRLVTLIGFTIKGELVSTGPAPRGAQHSQHSRYSRDVPVMPAAPAEAGCGTLGAGPDGTVDMFLLAIATGERVHAVSTCPATGARIRIDLTPHAVLQVDPPAAVVAAVDLGFGLDRADALACAGEPFFASANAASGWLAMNPGGRVFPVAGYLAQAHRLIAALEARPRHLL